MTKSLSFKKTSLALAVALSLPLISAQAAESYKAQDVVVTASRVEQQLADVNMSVSVITSEEIEQNAGAKTIADLLEGVVPGIRVNNDGGQGIDRIKIRGEDSFRTVVMIDGQRITEHKSMSGVPLLIDSSQVERIEVIRGPASVLYGSDAIGGVVNIIAAPNLFRGRFQQVMTRLLMVKAHRLRFTVRPAVGNIVSGLRAPRMTI